MMLIAVSVAMFLYVTASLVLFSPYSLWTKGISAAALLFISLKYVIYKYVGGAFFAPSFPDSVFLLMEALYAAMVLLFLMLLLKDALMLVLWVCRRCFGMSRTFSLPLTPLKAGMSALALVLGIWGVWQAVRVPDIRTVELRLPNLPPALDGFSIVQLTDTHVGPRLKREWLQQVVDRTNSVSPDLVVLTGDHIDGTVEALAEEVAPFAALRAKYGVYGVTGNHECYWGATAWPSLLEKLHVIMLHNEHRVLNVGDDKVVIAGMPDRAERRFGGKGPDINATLHDAPDALRILLAHQPGDAAAYAPHADLLLSGHTHGGLIFFLQPLVARFNSGFVEGMYSVNGMHLYVSPGAGLWSGFSCRIGVPSEITRLVLRAG